MSDDRIEFLEGEIEGLADIIAALLEDRSSNPVELGPVHNKANSRANPHEKGYAQAYERVMEALRRHQSRRQEKAEQGQVARLEAASRRKRGEAG